MIIKTDDNKRWILLEFNKLVNSEDYIEIKSNVIPDLLIPALEMAIESLRKNNLPHLN